MCQFSNEPQSPPSIDVGLQVSFSIEFTNAGSTNTEDQRYLSPSVFLLCISGAVSLFTGPLGALKDTTQVWLSTQCPGEHPPGEVAMVTALAGPAVAMWWCWAIPELAGCTNPEGSAAGAWAVSKDPLSPGYQRPGPCKHSPWELQAPRTEV